jgi:hypothetical protein
MAAAAPEGSGELERPEEQGTAAEPDADAHDQVSEFMDGGDREGDQDTEEGNEDDPGEGPGAREQRFDLRRYPLKKKVDEGRAPDDQDGHHRKAKDDSENDEGP